MKHNLLPVIEAYTCLEKYPVEIVLTILELSGHVRRGSHSVSFLVYF